jgi:chromosome segregation ATPase
LKISEKLKDLSSFQNETLVILCSLFFGYLNNLHDTLKSFEEFQSCKNLEETLKVEALIQDKLRTEKNYKILLSEHKDSEKTIKSLEDQLLLKEKELKNLQIKILENESDLDSLSLEAESLKYSLKQRERTISNLNKQLSQAKTLTHIEKTSQKSHSREVKTSKTPKGLKTFQLDPIQPSKCDSAKDQVIKNLKNQLTEKISSFQRLESRFYEIEKEKQELKEKVKILSLRSRHCSEEEEFQFETIASLKDELLVIDSGFIQSSIPSHFQIISKDSAVQVDCVADKKKGRFSCFSFFT